MVPRPEAAAAEEAGASVHSFPLARPCGDVGGAPALSTRLRCLFLHLRELALGIFLATFFLVLFLNLATLAIF